MRLYFQELSTILTHEEVSLNVSFYQDVGDNQDRRHGLGQENEDLIKSVK